MEQIPIAFQGEIGAYSQEAIEEFGRHRGIEFEAVPTRDFDVLFQAILNDTGLGMVPVENSAAGLVFSAMDLLLQHEMRVIGEYYLPVRHNLLGWKHEESVDLEGKVVHSHWQALAQCKKFIADVGLKAEVADDTAGAAQYVSELIGEERYEHFAIASKKAGQEYGLDLIAENIQDNKLNTTRFLVVRPADKNSVIEDKLNALDWKYKATISYSVVPQNVRLVLNLIHEVAGYNLDTINTRPTGETEGSGRVFNRVYYSDVNMPSRRVKNFDKLLEKIGESIGTDNLKFFGTYPAGKINLQNYSK